MFQSSTPASVTLPLFSKPSYSKKCSGKINYVPPSVHTSTSTQVSQEETLTKIVMGLSAALKVSMERASLMNKTCRNVTGKRISPIKHFGVFHSMLSYVSKHS